MILVKETDPVLDQILNRAVEGKRLTFEEGLLLYSCELGRLGEAASAVRRRIHPEPIVTFIVDRNISYTNACFIDCDFCAFYRRPGDRESYTMSLDEILSKVEELACLGGRQVLLQGGVNPSLEIDFYLDAIRSIHKRYPQIAIHSFSAVELDFLAAKERMPLREVLLKFKEAGLNSIPGGGAEILVERVRKLISPKKMSSEGWLDFMRTAHEAGLRSSATMVFGHLETLEERLMHMANLRKLQDETGGFTAFICWTLSPKNTPRMSGFLPASGTDYLKTLAIARLFLDNIRSINAGWLTEGLKLAQAALAFGANDMGGTLIEDKVLEPTGIRIRTRKEDLIRLIREAGFQPAERDADYNVISVCER